MHSDYEHGHRHGHKHGGHGYGYGDERGHHGEYGVHGGYSKHGGYGPYSGAGVYGMHAGYGMFGEPWHSPEEYVEAPAHPRHGGPGAGYAGHGPGCQCGAGPSRHGGRGFRRKYWSNGEVLSELRSYLGDLQAEISAVEEHIARIERSQG